MMRRFSQDQRNRLIRLHRAQERRLGPRHPGQGGGGKDQDEYGGSCRDQLEHAPKIAALWFANHPRMGDLRGRTCRNLSRGLGQRDRGEDDRGPAELRDRARGIDLGGVDYVTKPFNPVELAPLVRDLLDRVARGERDALRREKLTELRSLLERE